MRTTVTASLKEQSGEILLMAYVYNYIILEKNASIKEQSGEILTMADVYDYLFLEKKLSVSTVSIFFSLIVHTVSINIKWIDFVKESYYTVQCTYV